MPQQNARQVCPASMGRAGRLGALHLRAQGVQGSGARCPTPRRTAPWRTVPRNTGPGTRCPGTRGQKHGAQEHGPPKHLLKSPRPSSHRPSSHRPSKLFARRSAVEVRGTKGSPRVPPRESPSADGRIGCMGRPTSPSSLETGLPGNRPPWKLATADHRASPPPPPRRRGSLDGADLLRLGEGDDDRRGSPPPARAYASDSVGGSTGGGSTGGGSTGGGGAISSRMVWSNSAAKSTLSIKNWRAFSRPWPRRISPSVGCL